MQCTPSFADMDHSISAHKSRGGYDHRAAGTAAFDWLRPNREVLSQRMIWLCLKCVILFQAHCRIFTPGSCCRKRQEGVWPARTRPGPVGLSACSPALDPSSLLGLPKFEVMPGLFC